MAHHGPERAHTHNLEGDKEAEKGEVDGKTENLFTCLGEETQTAALLGLHISISLKSPA